MNAIAPKKWTGAEALAAGDIQRPPPKAGEVLVKVRASATTPAEFYRSPASNPSGGRPPAFPSVLGRGFSGVIASLGDGVKAFELGEAVFGLHEWFSDRARALHLVVPARTLARKPRLLGHAAAASVPLPALTAWQGLLERATVQSGQRVLIHGAAGSVGGLAVQLARWRGARVIATASTASLDFVRLLGAHEVIDDRATRFEDVVGEVDAVFDTVGGETLARSLGVLKAGGKLVTVASHAANAVEPCVRDAFMLVRANGAQLAQIGRLIDAGELRVFARKACR